MTMESPNEGAPDLYDELLIAARRHSRATALLHHSIADAIGLEATDHKYLDVLVQQGSMLVDRLAEVTGLNPSAVTVIAKRLEAAGLVRFDKHPSDPENTIIRPMQDEGMLKIAPVFKTLASEARKLHSGYTQPELIAILEYLNRSTAMMRQVTRDVQKDSQTNCKD